MCKAARSICFYILDGGARVETSDIPSADGDDVNYSILNLDVSGANTLVVGFEFDENGGNEGGGRGPDN